MHDIALYKIPDNLDWDKFKIYLQKSFFDHLFIIKLLDFIDKKKTWKALDIMMSEHVKHLYYPALSHQILGYKSTIGNKEPKLKYEFY